MPYSGSPEANGAIYLAVTLYSEDNRRKWMGRALLDSGAQHALIHPSVVSELGLTARGEADIDTAIGLAKVRAYILRVAFTDIFNDFLSAHETQSKERFVLGRQFLLRTKLDVNWPQNTFTISKGR
jgi:hypothetical protein